MAVSTTDTYSGPYVANGVTVEFPFTFKAVAPADVGVFIRDAGGVDTLVDDAAYNVTLAAQGGTVVMVTAPAAGDVYIFSEPSFLQPVSFASGQPFLPSVVNEVNDRDVARALWLRDQIERAPRVPIGGGDAVGKFPRVNLDGSWGFSIGSGGEGGAGTNISWSMLATAEGQTVFDFSTMPDALWDAVIASPTPPKFEINGVPLEDGLYGWSAPLLTINDDHMHVDDVVTLVTGVTYDQGIVDYRNVMGLDSAPASGRVGFRAAGAGAVTSSVERELQRWVWIEHYGGKADYDPETHSWGTDNVAAYNRAKAALGLNGGVVRFGPGHFYFGEDVFVGDAVTWEGHGRNVGSHDPSFMWERGTNIWHPATCSIYISNATTLRNLGIWREGLNFGEGSAQFADWEGYGLVYMDNTDDACLEDMFIGGFEFAGRPETITIPYAGDGAVIYGRLSLRGQVSVDCLNGFWLHNCADIPRLYNLHAWPFMTVKSPGEANGAQLKRPGWALYLSGLNDHTMVVCCFNYGYVKSFHVDAGDNTTWLNCDADYPYQSAPDGSFGYQTSGGAQETRWVACQAVQRDSGFITDSEDVALLASEAIGCQAWECRVNSHAITKGRAKINGGTSRSSVAGAVGIETANDPSVSCDYAMHHFANLAHATVNGTPLIPLRDCGGNTYANIGAGSRHTNRYQPQIASASGITLNGTDLFYLVTGTTSIGTIISEADYVGKTLFLYFNSGATLLVGGNIYTKSGASTAFAAGQVAELLATPSGWRQV
jgi:hypothetical protein